MSPAVILIGELLVKYGPTVAREFCKLLKVENPTEEQWDAVFALAEKSYADYVAPKP
jgi:hypothetical protein